MAAWSGTPRDLEVDETLRRVVVVFRVLSWAWMLTLVILTLVTDEGANAAVVTIAMVIATAWTAATIWAARSRFLGAPAFVAVDGAVALAIGAASSIAGAEDLFHAGMPMSWILVAAYGFGFWGAVPTSVIVGIEQVIVHFVDDRSNVGAAGSLVFIVFAVVLGIAFDALRSAETRRLEVEDRLRTETAERIRHEERADLADRLHDSVLQTLHVIRRDAADTEQVRYLARRQERALRRTIDEYRSPHISSFRAELLELCDQVEDTYRIQVDTVIRDDTAMTTPLESVLGAAREALVNAAKHSGVAQIDLYAEAVPDTLTVHVRDRGRGFDPAAAGGGGGMDHSLISRVEKAGGTVSVESTPGEGTEVIISMGIEP